MKVAFVSKTAQAQERTRDRLQVAINQLRHKIGWSWAETNDWLDDAFAVGMRIPDMGNGALFRSFKDLVELRKFQEWKRRTPPDPPADSATRTPCH